MKGQQQGESNIKVLGVPHRKKTFALYIKLNIGRCQVSVSNWVRAGPESQNESVDVGVGESIIDFI